MKESIMNKKTNWTAMVVLILGLSAIAFPLYMTIIIAFKQPAEMTNSVSGILSLPKTWSLDNFKGNACDRLLELVEKQSFDYSFDSGIIHYNSFFDGLCTWQK